MECYKISFEIFFSTPDEYSGFLDEISRSVSFRGGKHVVTLSTYMYADEDSLVRISFSEESLRSVQIAPLIRDLLKASGSISCSKPVKCLEIYEIISEIAKSRKLRIRVMSQD
ncbi:MAG: hypothetical protein ABWJ42_01600 [Sulfolobales archaeon]